MELPGVALAAAWKRTAEGKVERAEGRSEASPGEAGRDGTAAWTRRAAVDGRRGGNSEMTLSGDESQKSQQTHCLCSTCYRCD